MDSNLDEIIHHLHHTGGIAFLISLYGFSGFRSSLQQDRRKMSQSLILLYYYILNQELLIEINNGCTSRRKTGSGHRPVQPLGTHAGSHNDH